MLGLGHLESIHLYRGVLEGNLIHMCNSWIFVISCVCPTVLHGKNFNIGKYANCSFFFFFFWLYLLCTIDLHYLFHFSMTLSLPEGHKVRRKQTPFGFIFLHSSLLIGMKFNILFKQFKTEHPDSKLDCELYVQGKPLLLY